MYLYKQSTALPLFLFQGPDVIRVSRFFKEAKEGKFISYLYPDAKTLYESFRRGSKVSSKYFDLLQQYEMNLHFLITIMEIVYSIFRMNPTETKKKYYWCNRFLVKLFLETSFICFSFITSLHLNISLECVMPKLAMVISHKKALHAQLSIQTKI